MNNNPDIGAVRKMRTVGNVIERRYWKFAITVASHLCRMRYQDHVRFPSASKAAKRSQCVADILSQAHPIRPIMLQFIPWINNKQPGTMAYCTGCHAFHYPIQCSILFFTRYNEREPLINPFVCLAQCLGVEILYQAA